MGQQFQIAPSGWDNWSRRSDRGGALLTNVVIHGGCKRQVIANDTSANPVYGDGQTIALPMGVADVDRKITVRQMDEGLLQNLNPLPRRRGIVVCSFHIGVASLRPAQRSLLQAQKPGFYASRAARCTICPVG